MIESSADYAQANHEHEVAQHYGVPESFELRQLELVLPKVHDLLGIFACVHDQRVDFLRVAEGSTSVQELVQINVNSLGRFAVG